MCLCLCYVVFICMWSHWYLPAGATDGNAHLVVAAEAVQLVELVGRVAGPGPHLARRAGQLGTTTYRRFFFSRNVFTTKCSQAEQAELARNQNFKTKCYQDEILTWRKFLKQKTITTTKAKLNNPKYYRSKANIRRNWTRRRWRRHEMLLSRNPFFIGRLKTYIQKI